MTKKTETAVSFFGEATAIGEGEFRFDPQLKNMNSVKSFRRAGTATMLDDGSFGFVAKHRKPKTTTILRRTIHASLTEGDEAYYFWFKLDKAENLDLKKTLLKEVKEVVK